EGNPRGQHCSERNLPQHHMLVASDETRPCGTLQSRCMHIETVGQDESGQRWDAWVALRTRTVTDLFAWRLIVQEAYGMPAHFVLAIADDGQTRGALALYEVRHPLFGHYLTTAPFANDGGLLYEDSGARDLLIAEAKRLCEARRAAYVCIRTRGDD